MKIKSVAISRFRGYEDRVHFNMEDLRVLIGKNDIGKSTVLEALDVFFNDGKGAVKLDKLDVNNSCRDRGDDCIEIEVEFTDLPDSIVIDATNPTTLSEEYLLTAAGTLHVVKRYPGAGSAKTFIRANHPTAGDCADLLQKKIADLRTIARRLNLNADMSRSAEIRRAIWGGCGDLNLQEVEIEVAKEDAKNIWDQIKSHMPLYILFQSDRRNSDSDDEVQDPMRIAVKEILSDSSVQDLLSQVSDIVKDRLRIVSDSTLDKLRDLNPSIAGSLSPKIPESSALKWADVFKSVSIYGDDIPINKRGSGVKRLVLISFFRAEAERRLAESGLPNIVYAIEEPETSQHPDHQRSLADALIDLSRANSTQVIVTTHSPEVVKRLSFDNIMVVSNGGPARIAHILESELPYPSLNEVNFVAFGEATDEYHNELYGYIESIQRLSEFKHGKPTRPYVRVMSNGTKIEQKVLSEYIRHQIHHPENTHNIRFSRDELVESINQMRAFLGA